MDFFAGQLEVTPPELGSEAETAAPGMHVSAREESLEAPSRSKAAASTGGERSGDGKPNTTSFTWDL